MYLSKLSTYKQVLVAFCSKLLICWRQSNVSMYGVNFEKLTSIFAITSHGHLHDVEISSQYHRSLALFRVVPYS